MNIKLVSALAAGALFCATQADAASYSTSYVANSSSASSGWVTGSGDIGASVEVGDSLTVTFTAPTGLSFDTAGGFMFDYQYQIGGDLITEDATYTFYSGSTVVASGTVTDAYACCADLRLPVYTAPTGTWDRLVYTVTITSSEGAAVLQDGFYYSQEASYVNSVPEASDAAMLLAGLGLLAATARRRKA